MYLYLIKSNIKPVKMKKCLSGSNAIVKSLELCDSLDFFAWHFYLFHNFHW